MSVNVIEEGAQDQAADDKDGFIIIESKEASSVMVCIFELIRNLLIIFTGTDNRRVVSEQNEQPLIEDTDQGQLVHQILKTQKELSEGLNTNSAQKSVEIVRHFSPSLPLSYRVFSIHSWLEYSISKEWEAGRKQEEDLTFKEVEKIRDSIQSLTSVTNPIGKLFDFLQEDVDEMQRELQYWKDVNEKLRKRQISELELVKAFSGAFEFGKRWINN